MEYLEKLYWRNNLMADMLESYEAKDDEDI